MSTCPLHGPPREFLHVVQEAVPDDDTKEELMDSLNKGNFTMRILYEQLANVQKMGSVGQIMSMIPGLSNSGLFNKVLNPLLSSWTLSGGSAKICKLCQSALMCLQSSCKQHQ